MATKTNSSQKKEPGIDWSVKAWRYVPDNADKPKMGSLQVPSNGPSVMMPGSKVHSGMPIDANLAVHFIQNFFSHYEIILHQHTQNLKSIVEKNDFNGLLDLHKKTKEMHDSIVNMTYGMTLDKDLILKIISQPMCQGLRFYLCARNLGNNEMHLSLVTVGVDQDGFDLHYNQGNTITPKVIGKGVNEITTQSLTAEYLTPPPYGATVNSGNIVDHVLENKLASDFSKRFVLLNIAKPQNSNPNPQGNSPAPQGSGSIAQSTSAISQSGSAVPKVRKAKSNSVASPV